jgi:hypothetical protein
MARCHGVLFGIVLRLLLNCTFPTGPLFLLHRTYLFARPFSQRFQDSAWPLRHKRLLSPIVFSLFFTIPRSFDAAARDGDEEQIGDR